MTDSNTSSPHRWTVSRSDRGVFAIVIPLVAAVAVIGLGWQGLTRYGLPGVLIGLVPAFMGLIAYAEAAPTLTVTADPQAITLSLPLRSSLTIPWTTVTRIDTGADATALESSGAVQLLLQNSNRPERRYYLGGPWVEMSTTNGTVRFSHPDPPTLLALAPNIGSVLSEQTTPQGSLPSWWYSVSGLPPEETMMKAISHSGAFVVVFMSGLFLAGQSGLQTEPWMFLPVVLVMLVIAVWTRSITVRPTSLGVMLERGVNARTTIPWSSIQSISAVPAGEFPAVRRRFSRFLPGPQTYIGGDALVLETLTGRKTVSARDAESVAAALLRLREGRHG